MVVILASFGLCHSSLHLTKERTIDSLSFSGFFRNNNNLKLEKCDSLTVRKKCLEFYMQARQTEVERIKINGQPSRMIPMEDLLRTRNNSSAKSKLINDAKPAVSGVNLVKRVGTFSLVRTQGSSTAEEVPLTDESRILLTDENFSWSKDDYNTWERSFDVWSSVLSLRLRVLFDNAKWAYIGGFNEEKQKVRRQKTATWLRERVLQLGPTFIKLGQLSSTRSDLFPKEFVQELAKLQVHRAILHSGEEVVVKVQRPGLRKLFDIDLQNLKLIAEYFQRSETFGGPTRDWVGIYEECSKILYEEIDYINEGKNADRFRRDFRNIKWVRVPLVYWDYTATKVLTLEYVPGIKINNLDKLTAGGYDRSLISSHAIESYLIQILKTGFFHADPHPGNLAIDRDGSLIYYDFGMMGEIKSFTRERLLELFYAVYEKDAKKVMKSLIDLEALQPTGDLSSVRRSIQFFLDNLLSQTPDQEQTLAAIGEDLFSIATDQPFRFPSTFTFVLRAFSTLEGIGYTLDPDFSFAEIAAPYAQELLDIRQKQQTGAQIVEEIRKQADDARSYTISMPYRIHRIEEFVKQLEAGDLKLRVRVLESERAARKATILQMATMYTVLGGTLLNVGVACSSQGNQTIANGSYIGAGIFMALFLRSMRRVKRLEKFEAMV